MKMIWAVVRSGKVEEIARQLKKIGVSGCTVYPVRGYGEEWQSLRAYDPRHQKLEAIVKDTQVDQAVKEIANNGSTGLEGDGILAVFELKDVMSIRTKAGVHT